MDLEMATLRRHLDALGIHHEPVNDELLLLRYTGANTAYDVLLILDSPVLYTLSRGALPVPAARRGALLELTNRLNGTMRLGAFWVHATEPYLYHQFALVAPAGLDEDQVAWSLGARDALDHCYPAFAALVWGGRTPQEALALIDEADADAAADTDSSDATDGRNEFADDDLDDDSAFAV